MTAVADTSPRIVLGKIQRPDLLASLYGDVALPPAVAEEVLAGPEAIGPDLRQLVTGSAVRAVQNAMLVRMLGMDLGSGESEAIALAAEIEDVILIMDDADARRVARSLRSVCG